jgi:hypothetical protein
MVNSLRYFLILLIPGILLAETINFRSIPQGINKEYWQHTRARNNHLIIPLDGEWQYQLDESGEIDGTVEIPAVADEKREIIYRKTFTPDEKWQKKVYFLHVEGILLTATIRLNNEYLYTLEDAYSPVDIPIAAERLLINEENILEIKVSNSLDYHLTIPSGNQFGLWKIDNGIFRELYLYAVDNTYIKTFKTYQTFADNYHKAQLWVKADLNRSVSLSEVVGSDKKQYVMDIALFKDSSLVAFKESFKFLFDNGNSREQVLSLTIGSVDLWSPDNPSLYRLRITLKDGANRRILDRVWHSIGFYDLKTEGAGFLLNGKEFTVKGIDYSQFFPEIGEMMVTPVVRKDLLLIKSLGANTVMTGGRPVPEMFLEIADRLGIFVLQEFPVYFIPGNRLGEDDFLGNAGSRFSAMVKAGRNHPSVFAWGIGRNFETASPQAANYLSRIKALAREQDHRMLFVTTNLLNRDQLGYALDFVVADAFAWKDALHLLKNTNLLRSRYPGKPIVLGGIGRIVQPGNNNGSLDPLSEEAQAVYIEKNLSAAIGTKAYSGYVIQSFTDFLTDKSNHFGLLAGSGGYWPSGIFNLERKERPAARAVRSVFMEDKREIQRMGNEQSSAGFVFIGPALANLLLLTLTYKNSLRFRDNVRRSLAHPFGFFSDIRDRRIIPLSQSIWLATFITITGAIFYESLLFHSRMSVLFEYLISVILPDGAILKSVIYFVWNPVFALLAMFFILMLFFTFIGLLVRFLSVFTRMRINFRQSLSLSYWAGTNFVFIVPFSLLFFTAFADKGLFLWVVILWGFFQIWFFFRLINGIRVLLDVPFFNIFMVFVFFFILTVTAYFLYMQNTNNLLDYYSLLKNILSVHRW